MAHDQQPKSSRNDKAGKEQKDAPKKGPGQEMPKGQTESQKKDDPNRMDQNR
jgi:hypothetical protein